MFYDIVIFGLYYWTICASLRSCRPFPPISSPVSRTTETLAAQGFPLLFGGSDPHLTPTGFLGLGCGLGMGHSASMKFCIRSALSLLMVSVT